MSNYFVLECYGPEDEERAAIGEIIDEPEVSWNLGRHIADKVPTPIEVHLDPDEPGVLLPMFERNVLLMRDDMLAVLRACGVDNLQLFDAVVVDPATSKRHTNYKVVNIIGLIACADLGKSVYTAYRDPPMLDTDFEVLAIDESKIADMSLFRLAECVSAKLVHRRVKEALEKSIPMLNFVPPDEWAG
jgi:hypothetical protein